MNNDLVSRNVFLEKLRGINCTDYGSIGSYEAHSAVREVLSDIINMLENEPTAYDVDWVLEYLNSSKDFYEEKKITECRKNMFTHVWDEVVYAYEDAIQAVNDGYDNHTEDEV